MSTPVEPEAHTTSTSGHSPVPWAAWLYGGSWALSLALSFGGSRLAPRGPVLPWITVALTLSCLVVVPGLAVRRLLRGGGTIGQAIGLGAVWVMAWAGVALGLRLGLGPLPFCLIGANALLFAVAVRCPEPPGLLPLGKFDPWLGSAAVAAAVVLLGMPFCWRGFSVGGDEWPALYQLRFFLDGVPLRGPLQTALPGKFDVWNLSLALIVKVAGVELLGAYRAYVACALVALAILALLELASALFSSGQVALLALVFEAVYCLSDMQTNGEGAGMRMFARLPEDKYAACLLLVPLAQASFLRFLRSKNSALACGVLSLGAAAIHPLAAVWLGLSLGGTFLAALAAGRVRLSPRLAAAAGIPLILGCGLAYWMRSLKEGASFSLFDPRFTGYAGMQHLLSKQIWVVSAERGWYLAQPALVDHPLVLAAIAGACFLLLRIRRSEASQFLCPTVLLPVLLLYNPLTAPLLGRVITPGVIYRVLWMIPVSLTLAAVVYPAAVWISETLALRGLPRASPSALAFAVVAGTALYLRGHIEYSLSTLRFRDSIFVDRGEAEALDFVAGLKGSILAPYVPAIHLPAYATGLRPYPSLGARRAWDAELFDECRRFHKATTIGAGELALLDKLRVDYVMVRRGSPLEHAMGDLPNVFPPLFLGSEFAVYRWVPSGDESP